MISPRPLVGYSTVDMLDALKELGFNVATKAGISIGIDDMIIPEAKVGIVAAARKRIEEVEGQYKRGIITTGERYNKIIDIWTGATDQIQKARNSLKFYHPLLSFYNNIQV